MTLTDLASPSLALDAQGRFMEGADLQVTNAQSTANAQVVVTTPTTFKQRLLFLTVQYSAPVTVNATVTLVSALGSAYNTLLATLAFSASQSGVYVAGHDRFIIAPGDSIQVTAPAGGGGVTSAVAIYMSIMGLTSRAVDATS